MASNSMPTFQSAAGCSRSRNQATRSSTPSTAGLPAILRSSDMGGLYRPGFPGRHRRTVALPQGDGADGGNGDRTGPVSLRPGLPSPRPVEVVLLAPPHRSPYPFEKVGFFRPAED